MADIVADEYLRASWVAGVANLSGPTATEANGGLVLEMTMTPTGLAGLQPTTNAVSNRKLGSRFATVQAGSVAYSSTMLEFYKQTGTDTIFNTLTYGTDGFLIVRHSVLRSTAYAAGQLVQVYPVECGELTWVDYEPDTMERYQIPLFITSQPELRALVV